MGLLVYLTEASYSSSAIYIHRSFSILFVPTYISLGCDLQDGWVLPGMENELTFSTNVKSLRIQV